MSEHPWKCCTLGVVKWGNTLQRRGEDRHTETVRHQGAVVARAFQDGSQQHHPMGVPAAGAGARTSGVLQDISLSCQPGMRTVGQAVKHSTGSCAGAWGISMASAFMPSGSGYRSLVFFSPVFTEVHAVRAAEDQIFPGMWSELTLPCSVKFPHICAGLVLTCVAKTMKGIILLFRLPNWWVIPSILPKKSNNFSFKITHQPLISSSWALMCCYLNTV